MFKLIRLPTVLKKKTKSGTCTYSVSMSLVKAGFHLYLKGPWDMSEVPVTRIFYCVWFKTQVGT